MTVRDLPSVDALADELSESFDLPRAIVVAVCRSSIDEARADLLAGRSADAASDAEERLRGIVSARPHPVINATGVLLHTNLGRAPVPQTAADAAHGAAVGASNVEIDLRSGRRRNRNAYLRIALPALTGAEAGFAVNNNAGALLLALASVAGSGGRVAVSRGELIEIGGSFRLPELMRASGAHLVEVGTTNRTRIGDFEAVAETVDAVLKVHPSNYRIEGFHEDVPADELSTLAAAHGVPFIFDVGSGLIDERAPWLADAPRAWLAHEPGVRQAVELGADLVVFSADKLLGGPQAGILVGTSEAVDRASRHPVARAVRLDGSRIASLAVIIDRYLASDALSLPFWQMAAAPVAEIDRRSRDVTHGLPGVTIEDGGSLPGAGSVPGATIPTRVIRIDDNADETWAKLASGDPAVIGTRRGGSLFLDLRSVSPDDDEKVRAALEAALA
jgi:L-seryl-tRNA(Ser) seleniumtransferase